MEPTTQVNAEIFRELFDHYSRWPTDNVEHRMPQAEHFCEFVGELRASPWLDYFEGAKQSEVAYKQSLGAGDQTVGFLLHNLFKLGDVVSVRIAANKALLDAEEDPNRKHQVELDVAMESKEIDDAKYWMNKLPLEADNHDGYLIQLANNDNPTPIYWKRP